MQPELDIDVGGDLAPVVGDVLGLDLHPVAPGAEGLALASGRVPERQWRAAEALPLVGWRSEGLAWSPAETDSPDVAGWAAPPMVSGLALVEGTIPP